MTPYRTYLFGIDGNEKVAETIEELDDELASGKWFRTVEEAKAALEAKSKAVSKKAKEAKEKLEKAEQQAEQA